MPHEPNLRAIRQEWQVVFVAVGNAINLLRTNGHGQAGRAADAAAIEMQRMDDLVGSLPPVEIDDPVI